MYARCRDSHPLRWQRDVLALLGVVAADVRVRFGAACWPRKRPFEAHHHIPFWHSLFDRYALVAHDSNIPRIIVLRDLCKLKTNNIFTHARYRHDRSTSKASIPSCSSRMAFAFSFAFATRACIVSSRPCLCCPPRLLRARGMAAADIKSIGCKA